MTTNHTTFLSAIFNRRSATLSFQEMPARNKCACDSGPTREPSERTHPKHSYPGHLYRACCLRKQEAWTQASCPSLLTFKSPDGLTHKINAFVHPTNVSEVSRLHGHRYLPDIVLITAVTALSNTQPLPSWGLQFRRKDNQYSNSYLVSRLNSGRSTGSYEKILPSRENSSRLRGPGNITHHLTFLELRDLPHGAKT